MHIPLLVLETKVRDDSHSAILANEIYVLLGKGAIWSLSPEEVRRVLLHCPQADQGGFHPILDLRQLNKYLKVLPFQMLMLRTLIQAIRPGDWFTTVDLQGPQVL